MANHLEGRVIVITGAGGGFGRLVAQKTAARGAKIVASDVDRAGLDETVASVETAGGEAIGVVADVTDRAAMEAVFEEPEYKTKIAPDEAYLSDPERNVWIVTEEERVVLDELGRAPTRIA